MNTATRRRRGLGASVALSAALTLAVAAGAPQARAQNNSGTPEVRTESAAAQTVRPASTPSPADATSAGEIVVTARKRAESIRDVPATITATSVGELNATGPVTGTGDLLRTTPGVRFNDTGASNLSEISIRGSGTQRATNADSSVGLFVNGAYVGSSTLGGRAFKNVDFFDPDQVTVLKGPQGALYGRNSEFGAVDITLAKPVFKNTGFLDESFITGLDKNILQGVFNEQLTDDLAIRIGGQSILQGGGFYKNPNTGDHYDHSDGWIARGQLRYRHGPLDVDLLYDAQNINLPAFVNSYVVPAGTSPLIPLGFTEDRYNVPHNGPNGVNQTVQRAMLTASYDLGWAQLTSVTMSSNSLSHQLFASPIDLSIDATFQSQGEAGIYPLATNDSRAKDNTLYEDFYGTGTLLDHRLTWLAGAEVLSQHDSAVTIATTSPCPVALNAGVCGGQPGAQLCFQILPTSKACPAVFPNQFGTNQFTPQKYLSVAGYGSLRYDIGWGLSISGELRYTTDDKQVSQSTFKLFTLTPVAPAANFMFDSDRTNYTLTLSYKLPTPANFQQLLYARTGTGYRAGGVSPGVSSPFAPTPFQATYGDEDTTSYEIGLKGNLGRDIYFTINGYISRTTNAIAPLSDGCAATNACKQGPTVFNINAGTAADHGVEATINSNFRVAGGKLALALTGSDQRGTYVAINSTLTGVPILNSSVAQIPDYTASGQLDYTHRITTGLDGFFNATWNGEWGGVQDIINATSPPIDLPNFDMVSMRGGVNWCHAQIAFFVRNLLEQRYAVLQLQTAGGVPFTNRYNQPRTFGVDVNYKW